MTAFKTISDVAFLRTASSDDPERFRFLVKDLEHTLIARRTLLDRATAPWTTGDPVFLAAEIEAMAGIRRIAATFHRSGCECDACRSRIHAIAVGGAK